MNKIMLPLVAMVAVLISLGLQQARQPQAQTNNPRFTADGQLIMPANYREWVWLSSGLGMTYNPPSQGTSTSDPAFDNVFVNPEAYRSFMETGSWPDKTILILEGRSSMSNASINQAGHFQGQQRALEAEVKDGGKWTFYNFENAGASSNFVPVSSAKALQPPASDRCHSCHSEHGAVDSTFVQFYPTLFDVAKRKGTVK